MTDYRRMTGKLLKTYGLGFTHNPGGYCYFFPKAETFCQLSGYESDEEEFNKLVAWLRSNNAEDLDDILKEGVL